MRRAEWRRRADDPTTLLGWWWREIHEQDRWLWLRVGVFVLLILAYRTQFSGFSIFTWLLLLGMFASGGLAARRSPYRLLALLPEPPPAERFLVSVEISTQRLCTGKDVAEATFLDGFLHVEGYYTSFSLRPEDVRWVRNNLDESRVRLYVPGGQRVDLLSSAGNKRFQAAVQSWSKGAVEAGISTLPPLAAHPREFARATAWLVFGMGGAGLPNALAAMLHLGSRYAEARDVAALAAGGVALLSFRRLKRLLSLSAKASTSGSVDDVPALQDGTFRSETFPSLAPFARDSREPRREGIGPFGRRL